MAENNKLFYEAAQSAINNKILNANEVDNLAMTSTENLEFYKDNKHIILPNFIRVSYVLISTSTNEIESIFYSLESDLEVINWLTEEYKRVINSKH